MRASFLTRIKRIIPSLTSYAPPRLDLSAEVDWQIVRDPTLSFKLGFGPETGKQLTTDQVQKVYNVNLIPLSDGFYLERKIPSKRYTKYFDGEIILAGSTLKIVYYDGVGRVSWLYCRGNLGNFNLRLTVDGTLLSLLSPNYLFFNYGFAGGAELVELVRYLPAIEDFAVRLVKFPYFTRRVILEIHNPSSSTLSIKEGVFKVEML
jgi:hypothetical protein